MFQGITSIITPFLGCKVERKLLSRHCEERKLRSNPEYTVRPELVEGSVGAKRRSRRMNGRTAFLPQMVGGSQ